MIKAIFFDLDGTLIKSMEDHYISWSYVLKKYHNITLDKKFFFFTEGTKLQVLLKQIFYLNNLLPPQNQANIDIIFLNLINYRFLIMLLLKNLLKVLKIIQIIHI